MIENILFPTSHHQKDHASHILTGKFHSSCIKKSDLNHKIFAQFPKLRIPAGVATGSQCGVG